MNHPYRGPIVAPFKAGDVVELKGGNSPDMVVERVSEINGMVDCVWFDYHQHEEGLHAQWLGPFNARFPMEVLQRVDEDDE